MVSSDRTSDVQQLLADLRKVSAELAQVQERLRLLGGPMERGSVDLVKVARSLYSDRRERDRFFSTGIFGEPAWDLLIDLFVAAQENRSVTTSSACIAAAVPATTALRWLDKLENEGLIQRRPDPNHARGTLVELTPRCHSRLADLLLRIGVKT